MDEVWFKGFLKEEPWAQEDPTDILSRCRNCNNWFCLRQSGSFQCRECGSHWGDHHLDEWLHINDIVHMLIERAELQQPVARPVKIGKGIPEIDICYMCHEDLAAIDEIEYDHIVPRSRGGSPFLTVPVHKECNRARSDKPFIRRGRRPNLT